MIITVTLNAAIDKTMAVPNFRLGRRHRAVEQTSMAGGKGVNVARTLKTLGQPVIATGVAGGPTGTRIIEELTEEAILNDFVRIHEESRTSTAVVDPDHGRADRDQRARAEGEHGRARAVPREAALPGQGRGVLRLRREPAPRGAEPGLYADLVQEVRRLGVTCILDSSGEPLIQGTRAEPAVVMPNEREAEELVGSRVLRRRGPGQWRPRDDRARGGRGDHDPALGLRGQGADPDGREAARQTYRARLDPGETPVSKVGSGRRVPRRLRGRALRGKQLARCAPVRGGLRGRVDPAFRGRSARPARRRADGRRTWRSSSRRSRGRLARLTRPAPAQRSRKQRISGRQARTRPLLRSVQALPQRGPLCPPPDLGCLHGSRDRPGQEGP